MARRDTGATDRLSRARSALDAWAAALPAAALASLTGSHGRTVAELLDGIHADRDPSVSDAPLAEAALVSTLAALTAALPDSPPPLERASVAGAVRTTLGVLAARHPGQLVEVRVPPWGAVQIGVPGAASVHRRGTPPNVVECDAMTWLALADGRLSWADAAAQHRVSASGAHADLGDLLPLT